MLSLAASAAPAGFMYRSCPATCGLCGVTYLHGDEVAQSVRLPLAGDAAAAQGATGVVTMPLVGYGTAGLGDLTADAVFTAIRTGYRLVDSANVRRRRGAAATGGQLQRALLRLCCW